MRNAIRSLIISTALVFSIPATLSGAEDEIAPNPVLTAKVDGVNDKSAQSKALKMASMETKVALRGMIAETTMTMRFENPSRQTLEGEFNLDMPIGSTVTGYALDVSGTMVDGVLVPPHQAQVAYEQRVERRVDPGIVEVKHGRRFSTRVFPIFPNQGRTIRLTFVTPLDPVNGYVLPFGSSVSADSFKLTLTADKVPDYNLPRGVSGKWGAEGLSFEGKNIQLGGKLALKPTGPSTVTVSEHRGEGRFFDIVDRAADQKAAQSQSATGERLTILWDRSRSRLDMDLEKEIALAEKYVATAKPRAIQLVSFDGSGTSVDDLASGSALGDALRKTDYGGATSFAVLDRVPLNADTCLLFSDGLATLDQRASFAPACRMFAITSTRDADRGYLGSRARRAGGDLIDLATINAEEALNRMGLSAPKIVKVTDSSGNAIDAAILDGGPGGWRLVGEAPASGDVVVTLSGMGKGLTERRYSIPSSAATFNGPGALWAADAIGSNAADRKSSELLKIARRYSVASPLASFVVLETPEDYAQAEIDPPASYNKQLRARYDSMRAAAAQQMAARKRGQLAVVSAGYLERKRWWTNPVLSQPKPRTEPRPTSPRRPGQPRVQPAEPMLEEAPMDTTPPPRVTAPPAVSAPAPMERMESVSDLAAATPALRTQSRGDSTGGVSGNLADAGSSAQPGRQRGGTIAVQKWESDRPYITALEAASPADWQSVFRAQEKKYGTLPAFYLDVSSWLENKGRKAEAIRMALSALDLPTRNNDTLSVVAARLTRLGGLDQAIWLLDQLVELEPERPQPQRTLALALIQRANIAKGSARADLQRAFDLLAAVVNTPSDQRYTGIEQIALNDANAIAQRLTSLGGSTKALDPKLLGMLDTDIRIVVEWNTKSTDMDLWVDEPDDERIIYSHARSAKGGYLSRDMTQGFGPEEYFIRKAMGGKYTIRMNTFATDRLNPNGPTTVTARIYRNFGRTNQTEQLIDMEVMPGAEGERKVGVVTIGASK